VVNAASFIFTSEPTVSQYISMASVPSRVPISGGTLLNGSVLQFKIQSGNSVPDTSSTWILLLLGLSITLAFRHILKHSGYRQRRE